MARIDRRRLGSFLTVALAAGLVTCFVIGLGAATPATAQGWSVTLAGAFVGQDSDGSDGSFRSQFNLDEGFLLEDLTLRRDGDNGRRFLFEARGFGSAEPSQLARLDWRFDDDWRFELDYRRSESFFFLAESDLSVRFDDWAITRFDGDLTYDGWAPAKLTLSLGYTERSGFLFQPFFELNSRNQLGIDFDETREEIAFRLETRTLPVKLTFEQSLATHERDNRYFPGGSTELDADDPDRFSDAQNLREEERDLPVSRLTAVYANDRVEVAGLILWSPMELDVLGPSSTTFAIDGGRVGTAEFIRDVAGTASFDAFVGELRLGIRLAPNLTLRLEGGQRDRAQDANVLGNRIIRLTNPLGGVVDLPQALDESTFFDVVDTEAGVELEYRHGDVTIWGGLTDASREVDYRLDSANPDFGVERDTETVRLGAAWERGRRFRASVEYEQGDFEDFVFRTDPETVDRLSIKIRNRFANGFELRLRGRLEDADNPTNVADLDRSTDALGLGLYWSTEDGAKDFGFDVDQITLESETALILPDGSPSLSLYDLDATTLTLHGRTALGESLTLSGSATWLDDTGDTWPLEAYNARARLAYATSAKTEVAIFGQLYSYDEDRGTDDDFDVTRFGVAFAWRYE